MKFLNWFLTAVFFTIMSGALSASAANTTTSITTKARAAFDKGKFDKALILYEKAVALDSKNPELHLWLGRTDDAKMDFKKAIQEYELALNLKYLEPHIVYNDIGVAQAKMKNYDEAITAFKKSVDLNPKFALGFFNLGKAYYSAGNKASARALFTKLKDMGEMDLAQSLWEQVYR